MLSYSNTGIKHILVFLHTTSIRPSAHSRHYMKFYALESASHTFCCLLWYPASTAVFSSNNILINGNSNSRLVSSKASSKTTYAFSLSKFHHYPHIGDLWNPCNFEKNMWRKRFFPLVSRDIISGSYSAIEQTTFVVPHWTIRREVCKNTAVKVSQNSRN